MAVCHGNLAFLPMFDAPSAGQHRRERQPLAQAAWRILWAFFWQEADGPVVLRRHEVAYVAEDVPWLHIGALR